MLGACAYVGLDALGVSRVPAMVAAFLVTFTVRSLAMTLGWSLPAFRDPATRREPWKVVPRDPAKG